MSPEERERQKRTVPLWIAGGAGIGLVVDVVIAAVLIVSSLPFVPDDD